MSEVSARASLSERWGRWRIALRIALREALRGRSALARTAVVALMIGMPVFAGSGWATVLASTAEPSARERALSQIPEGAQASVSLGSAGAAVTQDAFGQMLTGNAGVPTYGSPDSALAAVARALPPGDRIASDLLGQVTVVSGENLYAITSRELDYGGTGLTSLVQQRTGRAPVSGGEVAITRDLARILGAHEGATVMIGAPVDPRGTVKTFTVVGTVEALGANSPQIIGLTGAFSSTFAPESDPWWSPRYVVGPVPLAWADVLRLNSIGIVVQSRQVILTAPEPISAGPESASARVSRQFYDAAQAALAVEFAGLVLLQVVLLAAPALAVGARRREHLLALVAAVGAPASDLRRIVLLLGLVMGAIGALLGVVLGPAAAIPYLRWAAARDHTLTFLHVIIPWVDLVVLASLGLLVAVLAALVPALTAARLDPITVLRGHRRAPRVRPMHSWLGLTLVGGGALLGVATSSRGQLAGELRGLGAVTGIAVAEIGLILLLPWVVQRLARSADAGPLFARLALRDADRHRMRTVPAVAAAMAAIAGATAGLMYFAASDRAAAISQPFSTAPHSLMLNIDAGAPLTPEDYPRWERQTRAAFAAARVSLGSLVPLFSLGTSQVLVNTSVMTAPAEVVQTRAVPEPDRGCRAVLAGGSWSAGFGYDARCAPPAQRLRRPVLDLGVVVGDGRTVDALAGRPVTGAAAALAAGTAVVSDPLLLWHDGTVHLALSRVDSSTGETSPAGSLVVPGVLVDSPVLFEAVVPESAVRASGIPLRSYSVLARGTPPLSGVQESALRAQVQLIAPGVFLNSQPSQIPVVRWAILALAALVTLVGALSAVALAAAEGRPDAATLAAVGAAPRTRRRLAATQALTVAGLGAVTGVFSGLLAGWVLIEVHLATQRGYWDSSQHQHIPGNWTGWELVVPWRDVLLLGLGLPLALGALAYLGTRSRLPMVRRPS